METVAVERQERGSLIEGKTLSAIVQAIVDRFHPEQIVLFGSYASDHPTPDSDVDLLIVMETEAPPHRRAAPIRLLFRPTPCAMDILVFTPDEVARWRGVPNHIVTEAFATGEVVYARA